MLLAWVASRVPTADSRADQYLADLRSDFDASRPHLNQFVSLIATGQLGGTRWDSTILPDCRIRPRILRIVREANGNLYFILCDSWTSYNVGLVARRADAQILGDGEEPTVRHLQPVADGWFIYRSS
jgi:hypothetical protein